uniref:Uncharacterized protein n=1 Tax=Arundo donax TaxID=35708 RepID=A0A0A9FBY2_ARUDO
MACRRRGRAWTRARRRRRCTARRGRRPSARTAPPRCLPRGTPAARGRACLPAAAAVRRRNWKPKRWSWRRRPSWRGRQAGGAAKPGAGRRRRRRRMGRRGGSGRGGAARRRRGA